MVFNILDVANGGRINRSITYSPRLVANWIRYYRNVLLKQDIKKNAYVPQGYVQDLGCLCLQFADASMCKTKCWGEPVAYITIPEVIDLPDNMGLTFFGLIDKQTKIILSDYNYGNYHNYNRFTPKNKLWAEKIDNTIYIHGFDPVFPPEYVNVQGVFADPTELSFCPCQGAEPICFDWDSTPYPIPPGMESTLYDLIFEKEVGIARSVSQAREYEDNENTKTIL